MAKCRLLINKHKRIYLEVLLDDEVAINEALKPQQIVIGSVLSCSIKQHVVCFDQLRNKQAGPILINFSSKRSSAIGRWRHPQRRVSFIHVASNSNLLFSFAFLINVLSYTQIDPWNRVIEIHKPD